MTLEGLLYAIGQMGINDRLINFAGAGGSIYEINDLTVKNYPMLYISPTGTHRAGENHTTYQLTLFYIDRLLEDNSNSLNIHSTAIEVLKNIIRKARLLDGVIEISEDYTITLFTETERMKDRCNGAYAQADFTILNDTTCAVFTGEDGSDSGDTPDTGTTYFFHYNNEDGVEIPYSSTTYAVEWRTNYPILHYNFGTAASQMAEGWTDSNRMEFSFPENLTDSAETYYLRMATEGKSISGGTLTWIQGAYREAPDTGSTPELYFYFITEDYTPINYREQVRTIEWRTNHDAIRWELARSGEIIQNGETAQNMAGARFLQNSTSGDVIYRFTAYDIYDSTELGAINIIQAAYEEAPDTGSTPDTGGTYFFFIDASGNTISATTDPITDTLVYGRDFLGSGDTITIRWASDYQPPLCAVINRCYADAEDPMTIKITDTSGTMSIGSNGAQIFEAFIPHLNSYNYNYLNIYQSEEAYHQNPNSPLGIYNWNVVRYTHFTDPNRTIMDSPASNQIFYKTNGGVLRDTAMNTGVFKDKSGNTLTIISNTYDGDYGIITCNGDIYYGQPFFASDMIKPQESADTLAVIEIIFPNGYGRLGSNGLWATSDRYFKTLFIPEGVTYIERTELIWNNIGSLENLVLPSTLTGGNVNIIERTNMPDIYFNNTISRWKAISQPNTNYRIFPAGTLIHCLDGDYTQV